MRRPDIIKLQPYEWQAYKELKIEAIQDSPHAFYETLEQTTQKPDEDWRKRLEEVQKGESWMVFAQICNPCELIGMAGARIKSPKDKEIGKATVGDVYVAPEYRGKGVGARLTSRLLLDLHEDHGVKFASLWVNTDNPAVNLYRRLGFTISETHAWPSADGKNHEEHRMELLFLR